MTLAEQLRYGKAVSTTTSLEENEATFVLFGTDERNPPAAKPLHIIDLPGHEKLRFKFSDFSSISRGVIFMVDSATFVRQVRGVAERLYDVLSEKNIAKENTRVLVVCNKQDNFVAWPKEKIQQALEKEIDKLRSTRTASLDSHHTSDTSSDAVFLGLESEPFRFEQLDNDLQFVECALVGQEPAHVGGEADDLTADEEGGSGLERIKKWMEETL
ncbi:hypothetical protein HDU93_005372 [Gonapodya sp. JEL0774]|nr:hypothetical protein HDU93_005372 [Gonapodya sp. JEL0774]